MRSLGRLAAVTSHDPGERPFRSSTRRKRWIVIPLALAALVAALVFMRDLGRNETPSYPPTEVAAPAPG